LRSVLSSMPSRITKHWDSCGIPQAVICSTSFRSSSVGLNGGCPAFLRGILFHPFFSGEECAFPRYIPAPISSILSAGHSILYSPYSPKNPYIAKNPFNPTPKGVGVFRVHFLRVFVDLTLKTLFDPRGFLGYSFFTPIQHHRSSPNCINNDPSAIAFCNHIPLYQCPYRFSVIARVYHVFNRSFRHPVAF
jgi:hypothetical protein